MGELSLDPGDDQIARAAFRRGEERVLRPARALQRVRDLVLGREDRGAAEIELGEHQRVAGRVLSGDRSELRGLVAADEVIRELEKVDRDARLEQGILDERKDLVQFGPREVERLEVLKAARAKHPALERLTPARELGKETFRVGARERR